MVARRVRLEFEQLIEQLNGRALAPPTYLDGLEQLRVLLRMVRKQAERSTFVPRRLAAQSSDVELEGLMALQR